MRQPVNTDGAATPAFAYSQGMVAGGLLFTAGCGPHDPVSGQIVGDDIATQTRQTLRNVEAILGAGGLQLSDLVKVTVHLADLRRDFHGFDAVYREIVPMPFPVRTTVGSQLWDILVEIDVVATVPT